MHRNSSYVSINSVPKQPKLGDDAVSVGVEVVVRGREAVPRHSSSASIAASMV